VNLRKDHCRNLPRQNDPRTRGQNPGRGRARASPFPPRRDDPGASKPTGRPRRPNEPTARTAPRNPNERAAPARPLQERKRLSATDISALASMKNVAKCDTWCELQNPVNHRVFERKLRPKPPGRGHVCLGVTQRRNPPPPPGSNGGQRRLASRVLPPAVGPNTSPRRGARHGLRWSRRPLRESRARVPGLRGELPTLGANAPTTRPQVRRDHPLSLSISISGGKETNEDSPSNGERTGKSPA
jgi:hypothetical protein